MKPLLKIFLASLLLSALQFALSGCKTDGVESESVYYGSGPDPWFHDDRWMDGNRGFLDGRGEGADVYISPPRVPAPPGFGH